MKKYYVNNHAQVNGDHEVHESSCIYLPMMTNKKYLGEFSTCEQAVKVAKTYYSTSDGCRICSPACHKR